MQIFKFATKIVQVHYRSTPLGTRVRMDFYSTNEPGMKVTSLHTTPEGAARTIRTMIRREKMNNDCN